MTAAVTDRVKCPARARVTHGATVLLGFCESGQHGRCPGFIKNGCGCVIPCGCTEPQVHGYYPHTYEEPSVLPDPFTVPSATPSDGGEKVVTPQVSPAEQDGGSRNGTENEAALHAAVTDWTERIEPRARPWFDGTGEPGSLEVMLRCFAMAAGDLLLSDDGPADYDETGVLAMLGILRASVRRAQVLDALLVKHLWDHGQRGRRIHPELGEVAVYRRPAKVNWDQRGTAIAVVDQHMAETGEVPDPHTVVDWVLGAANVGYYRKTALRSLDLDPQDFYTSEPGTLAADVPVPD